MSEAVSSQAKWGPILHARGAACVSARAVTSGVVGDGTPSELTIPTISSDARSNSSSDSTGVPSNGSSRLISSHERQPPWSSRTLTVTGRGMRNVRSSSTCSGWRRFHESRFSA